MKLLTGEQGIGSKPRLELLFRQHHRRVFDIALRFTGSSTDAGDIVQDVFIKIHKRIDQFRNDASIETWLYRVTINCCIDHQRFWRKLSRPVDRATEDASTDEDVTSLPLQQRELTRNLQLALSGIGLKYRTVIILRHYEEFSYQQIAEILSVSPGTIASRLSRAYRALGQELRRMKIDQDYPE